MNDPIEEHKLNVARATLAMPEAILGVMGGMTKNQAAKELGRHGGLAKSQRKAKACRENGKKGGRPKRVLTTDT